MIYPPINELVEKTGNRYSLVVITAKRAREIAQAEHTKERDNTKVEGNESNLKHRAFEKSRQVKTVKPIIRSLDEIYRGDVQFIRSDNTTIKNPEMN